MTEQRQLKKIQQCFEGLSIYSGVLDDRPARAARELLACLDGSAGEAGVKKLAARLFEELAAAAENAPGPQTGSLWQNYLLNRLVTAENSFTRISAAGMINGDQPAGLIKEAAAADLAALKILLGIDFTGLNPAFAHCLHLRLISRPPGGQAADPPGNTPAAQLFKLKQFILSCPDWADLAQELSEFHRSCGYGVFCRHHALRWDGRNKKLSGIVNPDPVDFQSLVGYQSERDQVTGNTDRLLQGLPAVNMLLYGDRGTGKSSTVKALLTKYGAFGLRLVELPRLYLHDYPLVLMALEKTCLKFIIFVDDLSFEEHEAEYRALKSMLDGSLQASPENVVIYATSNRRHLVREFFDERRQEVGGMDTIQEKLSLSDRFGVTVLFLTPDQELYLEIVEKLARQRGIDLPAAEIRRRALDWERWHNSRSGRTARQFVDQMQDRC